MKNIALSNEQLLKAYYQAKKSNLNKKFVKLLEREMKLRNLSEEQEAGPFDI